MRNLRTYDKTQRITSDFDKAIAKLTEGKKYK